MKLSLFFLLLMVAISVVGCTASIRKQDNSLSVLRKATPDEPGKYVLRALVAELMIRRSGHNDGFVTVPGKYGSLSPEAAKVLSSFKGRLDLGALRVMDAKTARALSTFEGEELNLSGLTFIDTDTAKILASIQSKLSLTNLRTIVEPGADTTLVVRIVDYGAAVVETEDGEQLSRIYDLKSLDVGTARALVLEESSDSRGWLTTPKNVTRLLPQVAEILASFSGRNLSLDGVQTLDPATARILATYKGEWLSFGKLQSIDVETAEALATFKGKQLFLVGLQSLDSETARALATLKGEQLHLGGIESLDLDSLQALSAFDGKVIDLSGLQEIGVETAKVLTQFGANSIRLGGLKNLDDSKIKILASFDGDIGVHDRYTEAFATIRQDGLSCLKVTYEEDGCGGYNLENLGIRRVDWNDPTHVTVETNLALNCGDVQRLDNAVAYLDSDKENVSIIFSTYFERRDAIPSCRCRYNVRFLVSGSIPPNAVFNLQGVNYKPKTKVACQ